MKKLLSIVIFLSVCEQANSQNHQELLMQVFSFAEVKKEILKYYGRHICYQLIPHDSSLILPQYDEVNTVKKVRTRYISSECDSPNLVIFVHRNAHTVYFQLFGSDGKTRKYSHYPLLNHGASTYLRVELDEAGNITSVGKYGYIAN